MRIAIVGSRDWDDKERIIEYVGLLPRSVEIVSGGARGVDSIAVQAARDRGMKTKVFPADWNRHGKRAGFIRNQQIVDYCDELVAFWDGTSRGTRHSIELAIKQKKHVLIHHPEDCEGAIWPDPENDLSQAEIDAILDGDLTVAEDFSAIFGSGLRGA